jgi:transcription elongation factor Elf1
MAHYRVFYSFTCPRCEHKNATRDTLVSAPDKETAIQMAHRQMTCLKCGELIPAGLTITFQVAEV